MKTGEVLKEFVAKDGRKVVLRTLKWEDLDDLLDYINSLIEENAMILRTEKVSRKEEIDWLSNVFSRQEKGEVFCLAAEVEGHVIANSEIVKGTGRSKHVGFISIAIKKGFRNIGIGTEIMKTLVEHAKQMELKVLTLSALATNEQALAFTRKQGLLKRGGSQKDFSKTALS